jgi:mannose-6-phosphate isomerase-like protein (cupin superfamily)
MTPVAPFVIHEKDCALQGWKDTKTGDGRWRTLLSGDRTPSDALTAGILELSPGERLTFDLHKHAQPEIYYVLDGEGTVTLAEKNHAVEAGNLVFIPGGVEHNAENTGSGMLRIFYVFPADSFSEIDYQR